MVLYYVTKILSDKVSGSDFNQWNILMGWNCHTQSSPFSAGQSILNNGANLKNPGIKREFFS
jgi:hypothetical protein